MGTGYTRNDTANNIANGNVINASDLDGEFDAIVDAFNSSTGHTHDGTSAEGAPITVLGPAQDFVADANSLSPKGNGTYDLGTASLRYDVAYLNSVNAGGAVLQEGDTANTLKGPLYQRSSDPSYDVDGIGGVSSQDALEFIRGGVVAIPDSAAITSANKGSGLWLYDNSFLAEALGVVLEGSWCIAGKKQTGETQGSYSSHSISAENGQVYVNAATSFTIQQTDTSSITGTAAVFNSNEVSVGTSTSSRDLRVYGNTVLQSATLTTTATTQVTLATFPHANYKGAKVLISANSGVGTEMTEILIATTGAAVADTQTGAQTANIASYAVDISGADVRIRVTPVSTNSTDFTVGMTLLA